jgi:hypothetical protein
MVPDREKGSMWSVILFYGSGGDEVELFATEAEANARCAQYAREHWRESDSPEPCPESDDEVLELFEHGSFDCRFDQNPVTVPGLAELLGAAKAAAQQISDNFLDTEAEGDWQDVATGLDNAIALVEPGQTA